MTAEPHPTSIPVPDPTVVTTENIDKGLGHLREVLDARLDGFSAKMDERNLYWVQRAATVDRRFVESEARHREQKADNEARRLEQKNDTKRELDAALTAQKESAATSVAMILGLIGEIKTTFNTALNGATNQIGGLSAQIAALSTQVAAMGERRAGGREATDDRRATVAAVAGIAGLVLVLLTIAGLVVAFGGDGGGT